MEKNQHGKDKGIKWLIGLSIGLCVCVAAYLTVAFSNIPFIAQWRTIYIETAMTTNSHQWLATLLFPQRVIDQVMDAYEKNQQAQENLASSWENVSEETETEESTQDYESAFYAKFPELDSASVKNYLKEHEELIRDGYHRIYIEDLEEKLGLETAQGDPLLVVDAVNELLIVKVSGSKYVGKLAIVKDPSRVEMVKSKNLGTRGQEAQSFGEQEDALIVVNASGFTDVGGHGSGGQVKGSLIIDGVEYGNRDIKSYWKFCGMKQDNRLYIGNYPGNSVADYRWSVEFFPALVVDGESVVDGTFGMGLQPRAAVGQTKDGAMLMLIIDGRQIHSIGCTVAECTDILLRYDAYQAMNLDGGSSAVMWYNGNYITRSSSATGRGRYMPNALIVRKANL